MNYRQIALRAALPTALALSGCAPSPSGSLDAQTATPSPECRVHQTEEPGARYTAGSRADTDSILEMMRYYTANGTKPFCDGKGATSTDRHWMDLYSKLGGERGRVPGHDLQAQ
ncbi:hypothetical protein J7E91_29175 [Streptomyces sp. ISL-99]|uniref:hypothetical protein n=1 Tax=Streptomyces sp. ISL-99 TaxID=2819193 RepID=UPI001BE9E006|nr:hypothetical protein [Streptomyces sp. ISL-99]MBT2529361.1 hypothetical protein [Streptomyces sp. ISL-99]